MGITNCGVTVTGEADHAGATPMFDRSDALAAAAAFILDLGTAAEEIATESQAAIGTAGEGNGSPNARNIVPEDVRLRFASRDVAHDTMDQLVDRCRSGIARIERRRGVETSLARYRDSEPSRMSDRCITAAEAAAEDCRTDAVQLHSAAMHDTANVAAVTDAGLRLLRRRTASHTPHGSGPIGTTAPSRLIRIIVATYRSPPETGSAMTGN